MRWRRNYGHALTSMSARLWQLAAPVRSKVHFLMSLKSDETNTHALNEWRSDWSETRQKISPPSEACVYGAQPDYEYATMTTRVPIMS